MFEPKKGKNAALNTGLAGVSGDLVIFTDDDVLPSAGWLRQMRRAADSQPSFSIFGGPIGPKWEVAPEEWLTDDWAPLAPAFGITRPMDEGPAGARRIFGANMAVRASIFECGHRFDESMGPNGPDYPMGSEAELLLRLERAGHKAWHVKDAVVEHMIRAYQMNPEWVLGRAVRSGRGQYRLEAQISENSARSVLGIPRYMLRVILLQGLKVARAKLHADAKEVFKERWELNYLIGRAMEAKIMAKNAQFVPPGRGHIC
jgi:GT2 family glycosyltransferase